VLTPGQAVVALPEIMTMSDLRAYTAWVQAPSRGGGLGGLACVVCCGEA